MKKILTPAAAFIIVLSSLITNANAQALASETLIYSFQSGSDGALPYGGLVAGPNGVFYGTTNQGGIGGNCTTVGCGTVYQLTPPPQPGGTWTETVLHRFNSTDGSGPWYGSLVLDSSGNLYGTTLRGGANGLGVVFELSPPSVPNGPWTFTLLHSFAGGSSDGGNPNADLVRDANGNLFGTTQIGGGQGSCLGGADCGVFYELSPPSVTGGPWTETILFRFKGGTQGGDPNPVIANGNVFLGTTNLGGNSASNCNGGTCGVVYRLAKNSSGVWVETVLYSFAGGNDGANPNAKLYRDASGNLFGTTTQGGGTGCSGTGCGTVFEVSPPSTGSIWTETLIHIFGGPGDGIYPLDSLVANSSGVLFGTAGQGGGTGCGNIGLSGCGMVFKLTPPVPPATNWTETVLYRFLGGASDGGFPNSAVLLSGGKLYGTTRYGGGTGCSTQFLQNPGCGTVYQLQ